MRLRTAIADRLNCLNYLPDALIQTLAPYGADGAFLREFASNEPHRRPPLIFQQQSQSSVFQPIRNTRISRCVCRWRTEAPSQGCPNDSRSRATRTPETHERTFRILRGMPQKENCTEWFSGLQARCCLGPISNSGRAFMDHAHVRILQFLYE